MTWHRLIAAGAALAALAIAAGAFGAHGLKKRLDADALAIFETGARYHMYGALAALALGLAAAHGLRTVAPGWVLVAGTAIFAGTLYALALGGPRWLGAVTPVGGTLMLVALAWAAVAAVRA
ncbi:MAG: DUF423 domain-containing protein [Kofleriaceae bacterium]|nr:DUF423 domain-containing protein [Kofleriaceae bacterium]MCL4226785.1 DUF423 domain-containing protein [Myxococcales bacterium]